MKLDSVIVSDSEILRGVPCLRGKRVPVDLQIYYLEVGYTLDEFLDNFPSVSREAAIAALEETKALLMAIACARPLFLAFQFLIEEPRSRSTAKSVPRTASSNHWVAAWQFPL